MHAKHSSVPALRRDDQLLRSLRASLPGDSDAPDAARNRTPQRVAVGDHAYRRILARNAAREAKKYQRRAMQAEQALSAAPVGYPGTPELKQRYTKEMASFRGWVSEGQLHGRKAREALERSSSSLSPPVETKAPATSYKIPDAKAVTLDLPAPKNMLPGKALLAPVSRAAQATVQSTPSWARVLQHAITRR